MTILQPITTVQTINYLGRFVKPTLTVNVIDKQNDNNHYTADLNTIQLNGTTTIEVTIPFLKEGNSYLLEIYDSLDIVFRGLCFCTSQTDLQNYNNN